MQTCFYLYLEVVGSRTSPSTIILRGRELGIELEPTSSPYERGMVASIYRHLGMSIQLIRSRFLFFFVSFFHFYDQGEPRTGTSRSFLYCCAEKENISLHCKGH